MKFFWRALRRGERGFTLIELLIVVAIIAILAAILIPNFLRSRAQSQVAASKGNLRNIGLALESFFTQEGTYPDGDSTGAGAPNVNDYTGGLDILQDQGYIKVVPEDPCTGNNYQYDAIQDANPTDYKLSITFSGPCKDVVGLGGLSYTPAAGLAETP